jgi:hypothetical protein
LRPDRYWRNTRKDDEYRNPFFAAAAATLGGAGFSRTAKAQTKHIRLYVEMEVAPERDQA